MRDQALRRALTRRRIWLAFMVAVATDFIQWISGPFGWTGLDQVLDVIAMVALTWLIGFHPILLPTFIVELVPIVDAVPTWTASVAIVVALRRKQRD